MHFSRSPFIAFAVTAMIGTSLHAGNLADLADRVDAVHLRHHDVHQDHVDRRPRSSASRSRRGRCRARRSACPCPRAARTARRCCACRRRRSSRAGRRAPRSPRAGRAARRDALRASAAAARCSRNAVWSSSASGDRRLAHDGAPAERPPAVAARLAAALAVEHDRQRVVGRARPTAPAGAGRLSPTTASQGPRRRSRRAARSAPRVPSDVARGHDADVVAAEVAPRTTRGAPDRR